MSEISASGFTGYFTVRLNNEPDLYAMAGRLAGLGYSVCQIRLSGATGYVIIPLEDGSFAKKNFADIYYQPRTFTVVSHEFGNFQLSAGELVRALRESGNIGVDYAELNVNYEKNFDLNLPKIEDWDVRGFNISKGRVEDRNYTLVSFTRINDANPRFLISIYYRGSYEEISKIVQSLRAEMESINSFIIKIFKDGKLLIRW
ncbi:hypothetical protein D1867_06995 [Acidianus infernus]|uniref:Uncharacterized protein n=1 Tax=Acidianus infernus TaxID=12915 RepID=A0A6A9QIB7_ACIIN|nr:hypothetical protein [Acidianus infernus]MUM64990.1 hypothetical protein [Acidianus infernus]